MLFCIQMNCIFCLQLYLSVLLLAALELFGYTSWRKLLSQFYKRQMDKAVKAQETILFFWILQRCHFQSKDITGLKTYCLFGPSQLQKFQLKRIKACQYNLVGCTEKTLSFQTKVVKIILNSF